MVEYIPTSRNWKEWNTRQKVGVGLLSVTQVTLLLAALRDLRRRPASEINGKKRWWILAAFVNFVGPIAYFAFGRKRS
jgi:hypothetical protein